MAKELTRHEGKCLQRLETIVDAGLGTFVEVGQALARIKVLCEFTQEEFHAYCQQRFKFSRRYGDHLIAAAQVVVDLGTVVPTERHARALLKAPPELRKPILQAAGPDATAADIDAITKKAFGFRTPEELQAFVEESEREAKAGTPRPQKSFNSSDWAENFRRKIVDHGRRLLKANPELSESWVEAVEGDLARIESRLGEIS